MSWTHAYARWFRRLLPSPFSIAVILTLITFLSALRYTHQGPMELGTAWQKGLWDSGLLTFAFQMMLMLVLGHVLALSTAFDRLISALVRPIHTNHSAAFTVALTTMLVAYFNWGLGLIFGAILARKMGEHFQRNQWRLNYPLIGAAGYLGLMVWHGGISGSSLVKVAESGHLQALSGRADVPLAIGFDQTVFSSMNLSSAVLVLLLVPLLAWYLGKRDGGESLDLKTEDVPTEVVTVAVQGAERLDHWNVFGRSIGLIMLFLAIQIAWQDHPQFLGFIGPDYINFVLLGLGLLLHRNIHAFLQAVDQAIRGAAGILIQFPLYFGILALLKVSGLIGLSSELFISISNARTFPLFTFASAGLVNVFVPSGGGQWAIQGPIIIEAARELGVPLQKAILALAYGDQLTNMLQPFWALPLLSITGLKARQILPYSVLFMLMATLIFGGVLLLF